ncbi:hypothetical protein [Ralstonia flatus]|nr:hypothetical protein [Ralstonia sp. LMG 32965]
MKKRILLDISIIVVVLLFIFSPGLLLLYRVQGDSTKSTDAHQGDEGAWPRLTGGCLYCRGVKPGSVNQSYGAPVRQAALGVADNFTVLPTYGEPVEAWGYR